MYFRRHGWEPSGAVYHYLTYNNDVKTIIPELDELIEFDRRQ